MPAREHDLDRGAEALGKRDIIRTGSQAHRRGIDGIQHICERLALDRTQDCIYGYLGEQYAAAVRHLNGVRSFLRVWPLPAQRPSRRPNSISTT